MLPPKRHDPIKSGIRMRLQREAHKKKMLEMKRELEEWKRRTAEKDAQFDREMTKLKRLPSP
jgi:hypothetical protein